MDDTQDKVRRNVVVVASLIVLIQFLDIDVKTGTTLGIFTISKVSETKFWMVASLVLVYVFQRYWFDSPTQEQRFSALAEFRDFRHPYVRRTLITDLKSIASSKTRECRGAILEHPFLGAHLGEFVAGEGVLQVELDESIDRWNLEGSLQGRIILKREDDDISALRLRNIDYSLSLYQHVKVTTMGLLRHFLFSKSNVDFVVPVGMAAVALAVCIFRLVTA